MANEACLEEPGKDLDLQGRGQTLAAIRSTHGELYRKFRKEMRGGVLFGADGTDRDEFIRGVDKLLKEVDQQEKANKAPSKQEKFELGSVKASCLPKLSFLTLASFFKKSSA